MIFYKNTCGYFDYEFEDVIKLFFLPDEIKKTDEPWDECSGAFLYCFIDNTGDRKLINIHLRDESFSETEKIPFNSEAAFENKNSFKALKKILKRKLFLLLTKYTGKTIPWGVMTGIRPAKLVNEYLDQGLGMKNIINSLKNDYFVAEDKASLLYEVAVNQRDLFANSNDKCISVYIGIPFCPTRCLYCSFSSSTVGQYRKLIDTYVETLLKEIEYTAKLIKKNAFQVESIYIGGGTPTSLSARQLWVLLDGIEKHLDMGFLKEYTLEAGRPDTIDEEKLRVIKDSRVSRISINPQTMNAATLERIGRDHTPAEVENAFIMARELGFDNINMDLICGLPGEDPELFQNTLGKIAGLRPDSLTVHTMAIKRASRLTGERDKYSLEKQYGQVAGMVDSARDFAKGMGLKPYYLYRQKNILGNLENVGYSYKGKECVYNIQIMEERQTIIACGAGAVTKVIFPSGRLERAFNVKSVEEYIGRIAEMLKRKSDLLQLN